MSEPINNEPGKPAPGVLHIPDNFEDAERFQRLFVAPMIEMVKTEMGNHVKAVTEIVTASVAKVDGMEGRVSKLEGNQKHALLGWGVYSTAVGVAVAAAWRYITSKIKIG